MVETSIVQDDSYGHEGYAEDSGNAKLELVGIH